MFNTNQKINWLIVIFPFLILFLISMIYFLKFANYIFLWQEKWSLFLVSINYLISHLNHPGGFLEYVGKLFTAFYYYEILGAVSLSLLFVCVVWITVLIGKSITEKRVSFLPFVLGSGMLFLQTHYYYMAYNNLGILFQLVLFYFTIQYFKGKREWLPIILFPAWYFLFGGFAWIYLFMFSIYLVLTKEKNWWLKLLTFYSVSLVFFLISREYLFFESTNKLLLLPFLQQNIGMQLYMFIATVALIIFLPLLFRINLENSLKKRWSKFSGISSVAVLLILTVFLIARFDQKNKNYFHVKRLFYEHNYDDINAFTSTLYSSSSSNWLILYLNNLALAEKGLLTERFFEFPQQSNGSTLFLDEQITDHVYKLMPFFYYEIGLVNEAKRWAYEYMVMRGYTYDGLDMLIKTELIGGRYKVAEKYISILNQSIFYRKDAKEYMKLLFNDAAVNAHPELGEKKYLIPKTDFFVQSKQPELNVKLLVHSNTVNVPVLEYYFSALLLKKDTKTIVKSLPLLEKAGYKNIPRCIEEALVSFKLLNIGQVPKLNYLSIRPDTVKKFKRFIQVLKSNGASEQQLKNVLRKEFENTYWYYDLFS